VLAEDSGTYQVQVNLWLALYKLTGWLASVDLRPIKLVTKQYTHAQHVCVSVCLSGCLSVFVRLSICVYVRRQRPHCHDNHVCSFAACF